ncbi:hypothetical protein ABJC02_09935, partial [Bifidobacterium adolescentis]
QDAGHARFNISTKNKTESAQEFGRYRFFMLISLLCFAAKSKVFVNQRFAEESLRVMLFLLLWARCIRIVLQTISVKKKGDYGLEYKGFAFV